MTDQKDTILKGYFVLAGYPDPSLLDDDWLTGNHTKSSSRGAFGLHTDWSSGTLNIPARDKQVTLWSRGAYIKDFESGMEHIDSNEGHNYKTKLTALRTRLPTDFRGVVNNDNVSTHGSLALIGAFHYIGVFDQHTKSAFFAWSDTPFDNDGYFGTDCEDANRYLVYRFPLMPIVFLPSEHICSKWHRWTGNSLLLAFNALERRLSR